MPTDTGLLDASIRCCEGRTAGLESFVNDMKQRLGFYSLSRRAYSGTLASLPKPTTCFYSLSRRACSGTRLLIELLSPKVSIRCREGRTAVRLPLHVRGRLGAGVSIRCREGRTAEPPQRRALDSPRGRRFYSLSRRAYSGTSNGNAVPVACTEFLFAVAKGVQRNRTPRVTSPSPACFYSLSRRAYSGTLSVGQSARIQVSIRCREGRTAEPCPHMVACRPSTSVSIRCREGRTAEPVAAMIIRYVAEGGVSIRCRGGRTAERPPPPRPSSLACFYSLSRRAYSGTR